MGAPKTSKGLQLFLRNTPLTDEDVLVLVESQARIAKSVFESTTLQTLGRQVYINRPEKTGLTMLEDVSGLVDVGGVCNLKTQGLFFGTPEKDTFWGYTRDGLWVICVVVNDPFARPHVVTVPSSVPDIVSKLKVEPMELVWRLQTLMREVLEHRKDGLREAEKALRDMRTETYLYYILKESERA